MPNLSTVVHYDGISAFTKLFVLLMVSQLWLFYDDKYADFVPVM